MIFKMENPIQHYTWGSKSYLPNLLNLDAHGKPWAELWMGAHPKAPSWVMTAQGKITLREWIDRNRENTLGIKIWEKFKDLPYLFKILSIENPLSIQVHPNKIQAREGYLKEDKENIPMDSPQRNYKDNNYKPELLVAISDMWILKGFRSFEDFLSKIDFAPAFFKEKIMKLYSKGKKDIWKDFFYWFMGMNDQEEEMLLQSIENMIGDSPEYNWVKTLQGYYPGDISVLAPLYLNLIQLKSGEAMYQRDGELHGYLKGNGIELMSNSDNVLRCGLTAKHMDIQEVLKISRFEESAIEFIKPQNGQYKVDIEDFALQCFNGSDTWIIDLKYSPVILLNLQGTLVVSNQDESFEVMPGNSVFIDKGTSKITVKATDAMFYIASPGEMS
ncbi:MAG: mannose-6-phosphate isomerase, class I [Spirochaetaceae bacterium]|jgi:mannose-6-phosphate isomerase|nr:mannose-6-phosphate isomerase, class I [Spirochaetaceae bacterium]